MNHLRVALFFAALAPCWAADSVSRLNPPESEKGSNEFVFNLIPKAFQKSPRLNFNVITEVSAEGRKRPTASPQKPVYYVAQAGPIFNGGLQGPDERVDPLSVKNLPVVLGRALAANGYRLAEGTGQPPSIVVIYQFGSYAFNPPISVADVTGPDGDVPAAERDIRRVLLNRALLLGGEKFSLEVSDAMELVDNKAVLDRIFVAPEGGEDFMGSVSAVLPEPFERLRARNAEYERLVDELFSSSYFAVATAYDYRALTQGHRVLLWRTKMTVNSLGVNMAESLPPLIASAAPYLGRETKEPITISQRVTRTGRVDVGDPTVQEHKP